MDRLSRGTHPDLDLEAGDTAVFSSRVIPGNERALEALETRLRRLGVHVVTADDAPAPIHASGHPCEEELLAMYRWIAPTVAIPTHGTPRHLARHAEIARDAGVRRRLTGENGDLFMIAPNPGVRRGVAEVGRLGVGEQGLEPLSGPAPEDCAAAR
jgi:ribonuclease J